MTHKGEVTPERRRLSLSILRFEETAHLPLRVNVFAEKKLNEAFRGVHCLKIHDSQISTCKSSSPYPSFGPRSESSKAFSISSFRSYASSLSLSSDLVKGVHACGRRAAKPRFTPSVARGYFRVSHVSL